MKIRPIPIKQIYNLILNKNKILKLNENKYLIKLIIKKLNFI